MHKNIVKLSKIINRKVGNKEYHKFIITIPKGFVDELEWSETTKLSMRLEPKTDPRRLIIENE